MVTPAAGDVHFLHVRPGQDAPRAARRMRAPSEAARELMANGGVVPGSLAAAPVTATTTAPTEVVAPAATPVAPVVTPAPTPAAVTPVQPAPTATAPASGGTVAATTPPQG